MKKIINEILYLVRNELGTNYEITVKEIIKNNGIVFHGLIIKKQDINISPTIYLDTFIEDYKNGKHLKDIIRNIIQIYEDSSNISSFDTTFITNFEIVKPYIIFQIINTDKNKKLLKEIPHKKFLDLSIIFKIIIVANQAGNSTITITNSLLDIWKTNVEELYEISMINTQKIFPVVTQNLGSIVHTFDNNASDANCPLFVISNKQLLNGFGCVLYPNLINQLANTIKHNLYIIPSSIHEGLFLPDEDIEPSVVLKMVQNVNRDVVLDEDFLSDNVYYYDKETEDIFLIKREENHE